MSETNENIHVHPVVNDGKLIISYGNELEPVPPVAIDITGNIDAPWNFWMLRSDDYDHQKCHVIVDDSSIELIVNEDDGLTRGSVKGVIKLDSECSRWRINDQNKTYTNLELAKLIKENEFLFADRQEWRKVFNALKSFEANVNINIKNIQETQGDMEKALKVTVGKNIPEEFALKTRIYGKERESYFVTIGAVVVGQQVNFYLDSSILAFRMQELREELLEKHTEIFTGIIVVINK